MHGPPRDPRVARIVLPLAGGGISWRASLLAQHFADVIERQQAAARGAVMAGAESQRRFDLDADAIEWDAGAIMGAVHDEASGGDGSQSGEAFTHPILRRDTLETQRLGRSVACG